MQTLGDSSADTKTIRKTSAGHRLFTFGAAATIIAAVGWIAARPPDNFGNLKSQAAGCSIAKQARSSYPPQNKTHRLIPKAEPMVLASVKQTAGQRCRNLIATCPYQLLTDDDGKQVLYFTFKNLARDDSRLISIRADLLGVCSASRIAAGPQTAGLNPETYIESDHPAIRRAAKQLLACDLKLTYNSPFSI